MDKKYYRVLNPLDEPSGKYLPSNRMSDFRKEVFAYRKLSHCIPIKVYEEAVRSLNSIYEMQVELDNRSEIEK